MKIIKVSQVDASEISNIYAKSWKAAYQGILPQSYLDKLTNDRWLPIFQDSSISCYELKELNTFVATMSLSSARDETMQGWGEIISLYVLPEHLHKGYGSYLILFAIQELDARSYKDIYLWVLEDNLQALTFYEKHGFSLNGDRICSNINGQAFIEVKYCKKTTYSI